MLFTDRELISMLIVQCERAGRYNIKEMIGIGCEEGFWKKHYLRITRLRLLIMRRMEGHVVTEKDRKSKF